jgi:hypothetical protein
MLLVLTISDSIAKEVGKRKENEDISYSFIQTSTQINKRSIPKALAQIAYVCSLTNV